MDFVCCHNSYFYATKVHFYEEKKRVNEDKTKIIYYLCGVETFRTPPTGDKFGFPIQPNILIHHLKIIAFVKFPTLRRSFSRNVFQRIKLKYLNNSLYCMYNIIQLNDKNLSELQAIAQELGIKTDSLKKKNLSTKSSTNKP